MGCCSSTVEVPHERSIKKLTVSCVRRPPAGMPVESRRVSSVYDGDTLTLEGSEKVRLLCIDAPELRPPEPYGVESRDYCRRLCLDVGEILLQTPNDEQKRRDKYGRLLALIFVPHPAGGDGYVCVNAALLEMGLANLYLPQGAADIYADMLVQAQKIARRAKRNIWKDVDESLTVLVPRNGKAFHSVGSTCSKATYEKTVGEALDMLLSPCRNCKPLMPKTESITNE